jgi:hypothetical protein
MTAVNHIVTGAVLAAAVPQPAIVLPIAFFSHFVLDATPHYGNDDHNSRQFMKVLTFDIVLSVAFILSLLFLRPDNWLLIAGAGMLAASPDLVWLRPFIAEITGKGWYWTRLSRFLKWIQWSERPRGIWVEIVWLLAFVSLFITVAY